MAESLPDACDASQEEARHGSDAPRPLVAQRRSIASALQPSCPLSDVVNKAHQLRMRYYETISLRDMSRIRYTTVPVANEQTLDLALSRIGHTEGV